MNEGDKKRIAEIIRLYDQKYPTGEDSIAMCVVSAQHEQRDLEFELKVSSKTGVVNGNEAGRRLSIALPGKLYWILKKQYPTLLNKDIGWFKKNFPLFVISK